jgi:hypothetical protein
MKLVSDIHSRFYTKVKQSDGCWQWDASLSAAGYAVFSSPWGNSGHIASYVIHKGPVPEGHQIDHLCSNPSCTNPGHLDAVTPAQDAARKKIRNRWRGWNTHCRRGHLMDDHTTHWRSNGKGRQCRVCQRARQSEHAVRNGMTPYKLGNRPNSSLKYKPLYLLTAADYEAANLTLEFLEVFWACDSMVRHGDRDTTAKVA